MGSRYLQRYQSCLTNAALIFDCLTSTHLPRFIDAILPGLMEEPWLVQVEEANFRVLPAQVYDDYSTKRGLKNYLQTHGAA